MMLNDKPVVPLVGEFLWVRQPNILTWNAANQRYDARVWGVVVQYLGDYQVQPTGGRTGLVQEWDGYRGRLHLPVEGTRLATAKEVAWWRASKLAGRPAPRGQVLSVSPPARPTPRIDHAGEHL